MPELTDLSPDLLARIALEYVGIIDAKKGFLPASRQTQNLLQVPSVNKAAFWEMIKTEKGALYFENNSDKVVKMYGEWVRAYEPERVYSGELNITDFDVAPGRTIIYVPVRYVYLIYNNTRQPIGETLSIRNLSASGKYIMLNDPTTRRIQVVDIDAKTSIYTIAMDKWAQFIGNTPVISTAAGVFPLDPQGGLALLPWPDSSEYFDPVYNSTHCAMMHAAHRQLHLYTLDGRLVNTCMLTRTFTLVALTEDNKAIVHNGPSTFTVNMNPQGDSTATEIYNGMAAVAYGEGFVIGIKTPRVTLECALSVYRGNVLVRIVPDTMDICKPKVQGGYLYYLSRWNDLMRVKL